MSIGLTFLEAQMFHLSQIAQYDGSEFQMHDELQCWKSSHFCHMDTITFIARPLSHGSQEHNCVSKFFYLNMVIFQAIQGRFQIR